MRTTRTMLAIMAVGLIPWAVGRADAGVSFSVNVNVGGHGHAAPVTPLWDNEAITPLAGHGGTGTYFRITVPNGQTYLNVLITGGLGDCDLYLSYAQLPTPNDYEYASSTGDTEEQVSILYPKAGDWYVLVYGVSGYRDVSLLGSFWRQTVHYDTDDYDGYNLTYADRVNTRVRIVWGDHGHRRPLRGLIPFVLDHLRGRPAVRHHAVPRRRREHLERYSDRLRVDVTPSVVRPSRRETVRRHVVLSRPTPVVRQRAIQRTPRARRRSAPKRTRETVSKKKLSRSIGTKVRTPAVVPAPKRRLQTPVRRTVTQTRTTRTQEEDRQPLRSVPRRHLKRAGR